MKRRLESELRRCGLLSGKKWDDRPLWASPDKSYCLIGSCHLGSETGVPRASRGGGRWMLVICAGSRSVISPPLPFLPEFNLELQAQRPGVLLFDFLPHLHALHWVPQEAEWQETPLVAGSPCREALFDNRLLLSSPQTTGYRLQGWRFWQFCFVCSLKA